jgi:hypothetical protein
MNTLDHLERVLSITEQFKPQLTGKDLDWWSEASAFAADERLLSDSTRVFVVADEQDGETVYWSNSFDSVDVGGEDGSGGWWVGDIESASKFSQEEIQSFNLPIGARSRWQDVTNFCATHTHEIVDFGPGPGDNTQGIVFAGTEQQCSQWIKDHSDMLRSDGEIRFGIRLIEDEDTEYE